MRFLWVGLAGALGSVLRYTIGLHVDQSKFPWATLAINISGSFALALFLTLTLGRWSVNVTAPIAVGFVGGYTTFSTFAFDDFTMGRSGRMVAASAYLAASVFGGLMAAWLGYVLGRAFR